MFMIAMVGPPSANNDAVTRANHVTGLPRVLRAGDSFELPVPLHELYELTPDAPYVVEMSYGDASARVSASASFQCPA